MGRQTFLDGYDHEKEVDANDDHRQNGQNNFVESRGCKINRNVKLPDKNVSSIASLQSVSKVPHNF